jgi:hypothetical protein
VSIRLSDRTKRGLPNPQLHQHCCLSVCGGGGSVGCGAARKLPASAPVHFPWSLFTALAHRFDVLCKTKEVDGTCVNGSYPSGSRVGLLQFADAGALHAFATPCQLSERAE